MPDRHPLADLQQEVDYEGQYERKIIKYLLGRYNVSAPTKNQLYDRAEELFGKRQLTMELLEQEVILPMVLRPRNIIAPTEKLTLQVALGGRVVSSYIGQQYLDLRDSFPEATEGDVAVGMCFNYPFLKRPNSASSLVLHDLPPTLEEIAEVPGIILCQGAVEREVWAIEPLGQLLDRLEAE